MAFSPDSPGHPMSSARISFLSLPFEICHRIHQETFESGGQSKRGWATILCLNKFIFAEAQTHLHGPLHANVLSISDERHHHAWLFEPPITFGRSRGGRLHKDSRLEASSLPDVVLHIASCILSIRANLCLPRGGGGRENAVGGAGAVWVIRRTSWRPRGPPW